MYTTIDIHSSAPYHGHTHIDEKFAGAHMPSPNIVAYASSMQLENFCNTHKSLTNGFRSLVVQSLQEWEVVALKMHIARNNKISDICLEQHGRRCFLIMMR